MAICTIAGIDTFGHFLISKGYREDALVVGSFARAKSKVRSQAANMGKRHIRMAYTDFSTGSQSGWKSFFSPQNMGRDRFTYCLSINTDLGKMYLLTTPNSLYEDVYNFLMENYKLPLKKDWMPVLTDVLLQEGFITKKHPYIYKARNQEDIRIQIHADKQKVSIDDLMLFDFSNLSEENFEATVSSSLSLQKICICEKEIPPLNIQGLDDYFNRYGHRAIDGLDKQLRPLVDLKANVKNLALKGKSLFPQQAASVEGIVAMEQAGIHYAVLNHGMGCGKTLEALSAVEASVVGKWLKKHPGKTLKDAYLEDGIIRYRTIIMAPGHLLEKWKSEIEEEIPYAHATIIHSLSQLIALREAKECKQGPMGKEFFIISKDFSKLDAQSSPIPTKIQKKHFSLDICADCYDEQNLIHYKKGIGTDAMCPSCQGRNFRPVPMEYYGAKAGLICPQCGELLLRYKNIDPGSNNFDETVENLVLTPADFARKKQENLRCYHCDAPLWGVNAKPLVLPGSRPPKSKWYRVSHFSNHTKKSTKTSFVLTGYENSYRKSVVTTDGWRQLSQEYGPRKVSPAHYIKKYLKGAFDFCILDECHKYLGESAQSVAAHSLVKASKFTIALTGTISNGSASCFYNLFFMLEPQKMLREGYRYSSADMMRFCKEYGCVETVYEATSPGGVKNFMSRGRMLKSPQVKPGISPVLLGKFLLDRCLFMDISDLSKYLPLFREMVELCDLPDEVFMEHSHVIDVLKEESQSGHLGMAAMSTMLQFGLSYPDKPYDRSAIMNPFQKDSLICNIRNFDAYAQPDRLLPKEQKLIELINQEMAEDRNCFVYASFTGKPETNVAERLKQILESQCNLKGRVAIIQSTSPKASMREEYFHELAAQGIKVFITNPKNVETGLDFCFKHKGQYYNFPTLIFYQTGYELATIWQASRRAYRLNQKKECRNYYLAYSGTLQAAALSIMAKKQVATAAIQGHFSAEGLASMAQGVDARTQLAAALSSGDMSSRESLENMFDALEDMNRDASADNAYDGFIKSPSFWELIGKEPYKNTDADIFDASFQPISTTENEGDLFDIPSSDSQDLPDIDSFFASFFSSVPKDSVKQEPEDKQAKRKNVKLKEGQQTLFDFAV